MNSVRTCADILQHIEEAYSNPTALNKRDEGGWYAYSTEELVGAVKSLALALNQRGLQRGMPVGILANSSPEWTIANLAIMLAGGISVPLFANISDENFVFEVVQTGMSIIFVEGQEQWDVFQRHENLFKLAIAMEDEIPSSPKIVKLSELLERGNAIGKENPSLFDQLLKAVQPSDLAMIIYTSGSTGMPKGVELSHENIVCEVLFNEFHWDAYNERYLSVLPLAHVFGNCINLWMLYWGVSIYYSSDYKNLGEICKEIKPTVTVVVPRLLEKIYAKMYEKMHHTQGLKRLIGEWAFSLAKKKPTFFNRLFFPLADMLVYAKLRQALGGMLRVVLSGGAPLNAQLHQFFNTAGITIYEGWGLTEACPVCVNTPKSNTIGTVGPPLPGQKLKITSEGEVLVRGSLVMRGYFRNPESTAQAIDKEGWLHTGDRGRIEPSGHLVILGRMKELYKTSTGEYVAPVPIEQMLCRFPLIDMAMVVAEGRKFTSCLLFPNPDVLARLKNKQKATRETDQSFLQSSFIRKQLDKFIHEINQHLNHWEQIHAYKFIVEPLTIQGGELTPSMKIRREIVEKKYKNIIDGFYER